ncbi:phosphatase PAP2 family protein [Clostridium sp. E02]|uniref:phosphatase PAP2 family protein n=1 Tax=Clostridium sp. E02 TaxID=2487134 RepID=UPI000F545585|nr:phosphatase PAP2 family protein [Clostridium sp. E02]
MFGGIEFKILYFLQSVHAPWLDVFMQYITYLGDHGFIWILIGIVFLCYKRTRKMGICLLLSLGIGLLLGNVVLKNMIARQRPCWIDNQILLLIPNPRDYSFPSGHSLAAFEGSVSIWLFHRKWGIWFFLLATLIAFSRLYLFVHFPTDVLAGITMGILIAVLVHRSMENLIVS